MHTEKIVRGALLTHSLGSELWTQGRKIHLKHHAEWIRPSEVIFVYSMDVEITVVSWSVRFFGELELKFE